MNEGRTELGTGDAACNPGYTCSTLITGTRTVGGACAQAGTTGVPQITPVDNLGAANTQIVSTFGHSAHGILKQGGNTITMARSINGDWTCTVAGSAFTASAKYIPAGCGM
ncbi:MAG: pilin [Zoogloeaceae bacterium]|nr:pilin [Zoogloeaceae bacterium]